MPALNFKKEFPPLILAGKKPFTLRALRKDGRDPKAGDTLYLFTGMRTKACERFAVKRCEFAVTIKLRWHSFDLPRIGTLSNTDTREIFARLDGFASYEAFCQFHEVRPGMRVKKMRLISWVTIQALTDLLYPNVCYKPHTCHCPSCWLERQQP